MGLLMFPTRMKNITSTTPPPPIPSSISNISISLLRIAPPPPLHIEDYGLLSLAGVPKISGMEIVPPPPFYLSNPVVNPNDTKTEAV